METSSTAYSNAALAFLNGSAAVEDSSFFTYEHALTDASPALSLLSTPGLECFDTPDTVASHDFSTDTFLPRLPNVESSFNTFGHDYALFDDNYEVPSNHKFDSDPLFAACLADDPSDPLSLDLVQSVDNRKLSDSSSAAAAAPRDLFVEASALVLDPATLSTPSSPVAATQDYEQTPPSLSRDSSSSCATFAVPKLPRGRKRKASPSDDADFEPTRRVTSTPRKTTAKDPEDTDERAALRAKNTEAAARSRARKRAAMESAENRIRKLEEDNAALRQLIAQKDKLLEIYQA